MAEAEAMQAISVPHIKSGQMAKELKPRTNLLTRLRDSLESALYQKLLPSHQVFRSHEYLPDLKIDRNFWLNMIDVRRQMRRTFPQALESAEAMKQWFARLHKTAVLGTKGNREYQGISGMKPIPGEYRTALTGLVISDTTQDVRRELKEWSGLLDGIIDPEALGLQPSVLPGLDGSCVSMYGTNARLGLDHEILYPNPDKIGNFLGVIWQTAKDIETGKSKDIVADVGKIIVYWATAHPFPGVNHSLIMNFANFLLDRHGLKTVPAAVSLWPISVLIQEKFPRYFKAFYNQYGISKTVLPKRYGKRQDISPQASHLPVALAPV